MQREAEFIPHIYDPVDKNTDVLWIAIDKKRQLALLQHKVTRKSDHNIIDTTMSDVFVKIWINDDQLPTD